MKINYAFESGSRWLIVDDNENVLLLLSALAAQLTNAEIDCFSSPREAEAAFAQAPDKYQLVITDLEMPGVDGIQLCRRLRAISPAVKVLLTTGSRLLTGAEAVQNGFCGLLQKPFRVSVLKNLLAAAGVEAVERGNYFNHVLTPA
jgi:CheY-like chemotaxis protein